MKIDKVLPVRYYIEVLFIHTSPMSLSTATDLPESTEVPYPPLIEDYLKLYNQLQDALRHPNNTTEKLHPELTKAYEHTPMRVGTQELVVSDKEGKKEDYHKTTVWTTKNNHIYIDQFFATPKNDGWLPCHITLALTHNNTIQVQVQHTPRVRLLATPDTLDTKLSTSGDIGQLGPDQGYFPEGAYEITSLA